MNLITKPMFWCILPNDPSLLYSNTYCAALKNIAKKYNIPFENPGISTLDQHINYTFDLPKELNPVIFMCHHPNWDACCEAVIKKQCPQAKIIMTGSDTLYYGVDGCTAMSNIVLYIDTIKKQVELLSEKLPTEHIYWTISNDLINKCKQHTPVHKNQQCISLCTPTFYRMQLFNFISNNGFVVQYNLQERNFTNILQAYHQSKFVIGTTSPCAGFGEHNHRSMKGMRDWIGAYCGAVLISDDYPDMVDIGNDIVPIYEYNNPHSLLKLITELNQDHDLYQHTLQQQQKWLSQHTMENQLENILLKHKIIEV